MPTMIGHVTQERYDKIVTCGRELVELQTRSQFELGDLALEIEPMQPHGGAHPNQGETLFGVLESLQLFADDLAIQVERSGGGASLTLRWITAPEPVGGPTRPPSRPWTRSSSTPPWCSRRSNASTTWHAMRRSPCG